MQAFNKGERRENKAQKPTEIQNQGLGQTSAENQKISGKVAVNKIGWTQIFIDPVG